MPEPGGWSRRAFVARVGGAAAAGAVGAVGLPAGAAEAAEAATTTGAGDEAGRGAIGGSGRPVVRRSAELVEDSVASIARRIRARELSSAEVVDAYLRRIEEVNPALNAVVLLTADTARAAARAADARLARGEADGPLHGVPMTIKDSLDTAGVVSTAGTQGRAAHVPAEDATVVARLKAAGAILLGKTNTPELTFSFETNNAVYGRTNNPYDLERTSGGSSGGAAAIVAAAGSPFDIGSDTGGSIRLPAHFCGIAGIKPTSGRVPRTGHIVDHVGALQAFTQLGPMARWVEDLALILPIIAGPDGRDPYVVPVPLRDPAKVDLRSLRVAFHTDNGVRTPTPEIVATVRRAAAVLEPEVARVVEAAPEGLGEAAALSDALWVSDAGAWVERLLRRSGTGPDVPSRLREGLANYPGGTAAELTEIVERIDALRGRMLAFFEANDVIVCPANAHPALPHGVAMSEEVYPAFYYTQAYNVLGWPGAVVRGGTSPEGLPIGVQVLAAPWRDDVALAIAGVLEGEMGGWVAPGGV